MIAAPATNAPPSFDETAPARSIPENARAGAAVGSPVTASDPDSGDTLSYTISGDLFTIHGSSGQIRVKDDGSLDHEMAPTRTVIVTASDTSTETATTTVTITITNVNEPPQTNSDSATTNEDESVTIYVLANDSDEDVGDTLTVEPALPDEPGHGTATVEPDGTITYTPDAHYHGVDSFRYRVRDAGGLTSAATVSISVTSVNDAPAFPAATAERAVSEQAEAADPVGAPVTAMDIDGDVLTYSLSGADQDAFDIDDGGQIKVATAATLDAAREPSLMVTVTADDGKRTASIDVTITVTAGPVRPPVITGGGTTGGGTTGGGGGGGGPSGPSPSDVDFEWTVKRDIDELDAGHNTPTGMWSDGTTLWLAENGDGADDALHAYDLESGERLGEREFALHERNRAPRGVWSDRATLWIADSGRDTLFAHDLVSGERLPERDIELHEDNADARGIWSDGVTMWVLDDRADALFAYDLATGQLLARYALASSNNEPRGIWSDGVTVWVSDHGAKRIFAYRLPTPAQEETTAGEVTAQQTTEVEVLTLERVPDEEFGELSSASNNSPRGIWANDDVMYVADESDGRVYTYNMPDAIDARLATLTLSGIDLGIEFDSGQPEYRGVIEEGVRETTIGVSAMQRRTSIDIQPPDADGIDSNGHQIALEGLEEITVTVTSADGSRTKTYRVAFEQPPAELALSPTWTSFQWPGAGGTAMADALREGGITDRVLVIYQWDEAAQTWKGFFPGLEDVPGLNTLTTFTAGNTYWMAVTESLTWTVPAGEGPGATSEGGM